MKFFLTITSAYILFSCCTKNSAPINENPKSHADSLALIINSWMLIQDSLNAYHNTFHDSDNIIGQPGGSWNFKTNNIVEANYLQLSGSYQFTNESKLVVPVYPDPATILVLDSNNLIFEWNEPDTGTAHAFYRKIILER